LISLTLIDRRGQCEQQVHLFGREAERHVRAAPSVVVATHDDTFAATARGDDEVERHVRENMSAH
jgi:hypothetical protein